MSSRRRLQLIVAIVAVAAAGVSAAVAWSGRPAAPAERAPAGPRAGVPPLQLDLLLDDQGLAASVQAAEDAYNDTSAPEATRLREARRAFGAILAEHPGFVPAQVGAAMAAWPDGTLPKLRELAASHPDSGDVQLHLGLALLWKRQDAAAQAAWRRAEQVAPDSISAVRAEGLLHPEMAPGRPFFVSGQTFRRELEQLPPLEQLAELKRRAERQGTAAAWLLYGSRLQQVGRVVSAGEAFSRAAELAPDDPVALTADAVGRFTKDNPSATFSRLGPLGKRFPGSAVVRFHLGLCLLWLREVGQARTELEQAIDAEPGSVWASQARELLAALDRGASTG